MNSFAFLAMLASFAAVLGWYVWSHERGTDGRRGLFGVRTVEDDGKEAADPSRGGLYNAAGRRTEAATSLERVRERARAASGQGPGAEQG
jgi:hypothetical protein